MYTYFKTFMFMWKAVIFGSYYALWKYTYGNFGGFQLFNRSTNQTSYYVSVPCTFNINPVYLLGRYRMGLIYMSVRPSKIIECFILAFFKIQA